MEKRVTALPLGTIPVLLQKGGGVGLALEAAFRRQGGDVSGSTGAGDAKSLVLQATDIVELIGQSVALKRRGRDFVGLCPFHQEKTPSFHVSPTKQFFHCYGCKSSGNAIDFV